MVNSGRELIWLHPLVYSSMFNSLQPFLSTVCIIDSFVHRFLPPILYPQSESDRNMFLTLPYWIHIHSFHPLRHANQPAGNLRSIWEVADRFIQPSGKIFFNSWSVGIVRYCSLRFYKGFLRCFNSLYKSEMLIDVIICYFPFMVILVSAKIASYIRE